ncbi:amidase family protein [Antarcticimicrobium sediminis]|uniref:Amidase n=1 Tax=Antarcticimicrobium sediminis TaxID=2546227 RepID=A0A4V2Z8P4_9RHOB|nr:amidase family protein [Antarcticimicrobium sediminis]TDE41126.1 amidase [Antarcticimicrobium sediminis]
MSDTSLWRLSAAETAARTTSGDITAEAAIGASIDRMEAVNPRLNAVVESLADEARARARALDKARASGAPCGPLHGVPVTIKINVDQTGHATSNGVTAFKDLIAPGDAPIVDNLHAAGAVVIGRTNTPEFSFRADTDNPLFGRTHNPWGDHISSGGSTGGGGAAVMAGIGALAHGNDIGGSLRFPSAANGAVTVKPGLGRVPAYNPSQTGERGILAQAMSVQGLITRSARDLHLSMPTAITPDPRDPFHIPLPWRGAPLEGPITVGFTKETYEFDLHPEVSLALDAARDALNDAGYNVVEIDPPLLRDAGMEGYRALMGEVLALMGPDIRAHGSDTVQAIFDEYFRQFAPYEGLELMQMMAKRTHYARVWSLFLEEYPLVIAPFLPQPFFAPDRDTEGAEGVREVLGSALWSYAMNFMGLPAACVPTRLADLPNGPQPINVQIIARRWREDLAVDACIAIEDRLGQMCDPLWAQMEKHGA